MRRAGARSAVRRGGTRDLRETRCEKTKQDGSTRGRSADRDECGAVDGGAGERQCSRSAVRGPCAGGNAVAAGRRKVDAYAERPELRRQDGRRSGVGTNRKRAGQGRPRKTGLGSPARPLSSNG